MSQITILDASNNPMGPFSRDQVNAKLQAGEVTLSSLAFVEGLAQWTPLREVMAKLDAAAPPSGAMPTPPAPMMPKAAGYSFAATMEPPSHLVYAGFWLRLVAYLIDTVLLDIVLITLSFFIGLGIGLIFSLSGHVSTYGQSDDFASNLAGGIAGILSVILMWLYFALLESSAWQATVGKKLLGLKVTTLDGRRIGFGQATGRFFSKILSGLILLMGYVMAGFTARKQALHDMIANTLVVRN